MQISLCSQEQSFPGLTWKRRDPFQLKIPDPPDKELPRYTGNTESHL